MSFNFHLFTASELQRHFADQFDVEEPRGLDLFHSRFAPDPWWNPALLAISWSVSRKPTLKAPGSWNARPISYSSRAAGKPWPIEPQPGAGYDKIFMELIFNDHSRHLVS
jgi:hypothetical protein